MAPHCVWVEFGESLAMAPFDCLRRKDKPGSLGYPQLSTPLHVDSRSVEGLPDRQRFTRLAYCLGHQQVWRPGHFVGKCVC